MKPEPPSRTHRRVGTKAEVRRDCQAATRGALRRAQRAAQRRPRRLQPAPVGLMVPTQARTADGGYEIWSAAGMTVGTAIKEGSTWAVRTLKGRTVVTGARTRKAALETAQGRTWPV